MCSGKVPESDNTESTFQERSEEDWDEYTETGGEYAWYDADDDDEEDVYDEDGHLLEKRSARRSTTLTLPAVGLKAKIKLVSSSYKTAPDFLRWMANQGGKFTPMAYQYVTSRSVPL